MTSGFISAPQTWTETGIHPASNRCLSSTSLGVALIKSFANTAWHPAHVYRWKWLHVPSHQLTKNSPLAFTCIIPQVIQLHPCWIVCFWLTWIKNKKKFSEHLRIDLHLTERHKLVLSCQNGLAGVFFLHEQASPWCEFNGGEGKKSKSSLGEIERLKNGCTHVCAQAAQPYTPIGAHYTQLIPHSPDRRYTFLIRIVDSTPIHGKWAEITPFHTSWMVFYIIHFLDLYLVIVHSWSQWCVFIWASKRPPASDHSAVIVATTLGSFSHLPELLLIMQYSGTQFISS